MTWLKDLISEPDRAVPPLGTFMKIPAVETVEIVKLAGFDSSSLTPSTPC